jgi:hypothetical protein
MEELEIAPQELSDDVPQIDELIKKDKKSSGDRTVETMFRTTISNHIRLSDMADQKAGLLLSVNAIIISIMTGLMIREISINHVFIIPTAILIAICLLSITFSLIATRPYTKDKSIKGLTPEEILNLDLLFFADYTALTLDQYKEALSSKINKNEDVKDMLIKNIYAQGLSIKRKYKYIKLAYTIFMFGLPLAMLSYLITVYFA